MSQADDQLAIIQLISRYYQTVDALDFAGWADCFAPGGRFEGAYASYDAHADLARFEADSRKLEETWKSLRHSATAPVIALDGDRASAESNFLMTSVTGGSGADTQIAVVMAGRYRDQLERTSDGWRFRERRSLADGPDEQA